MTSTDPNVLFADASSTGRDGEEWFEAQPFVLCVEPASVEGTHHEGLGIGGLNSRGPWWKRIGSGKALRTGLESANVTE